jgi:hypothetical protein
MLELPRYDAFMLVSVIDRDFACLAGRRSAVPGFLLEENFLLRRSNTTINGKSFRPQEHLYLICGTVRGK